jgi:hypothetical protein
MAENGEKRDPKSHRTPGQRKRYTRTYDAKPEQKKARAQRNAARAEMQKSGKVKKGDGKDVNHKNPIRSGGSNSKSNLSVTSPKKNRGWNRKPKT